MVDERFFRKAMGICVPDKDTLLLATLFQIIKFNNVLEPGQQINNRVRRLLCAARNLRHRRARRP